jgi:Na+-transporting methylmalonyl-CoA/oxaloacetate decarboxylase beta subunit
MNYVKTVEYDIAVAGGGVAGVAAAVEAARSGKKVVLIEKATQLGGLATIGLINLFVPMCNGRGTQIIKGMAEEFLRLDTLLILGLGLFAFIFDTAGGVLFAKLINLFLPKGKKMNPMIGAAGISAFPMSGRIVHKMGLEEDNQNFLLMHSIGVNVSGQIASVIAGGMILTFFGS